MYVVLALAVLFYIWARRQARRDRSESTSVPGDVPSRYPSMLKPKRTALRAEVTGKLKKRSKERTVEQAAIAAAYLRKMLAATPQVAFHGLRKSPGQSFTPCRQGKAFNEFLARRIPESRTKAYFWSEIRGLIMVEV